jgi:hypothetical protein
MYIFLKDVVARHKPRVSFGGVDFCFGSARVNQDVGARMLKSHEASVSASPSDWGSTINGEQVTLASRISPELRLAA